MGQITYEVIRVDDPEWNPGAGWYVVADYDATEYIAYCGPLDYPQAELDAHRVARALNDYEAAADALEWIASRADRRADGTYNYDRDALRDYARTALLRLRGET